MPAEGLWRNFRKPPFAYVRRVCKVGRINQAIADDAEMTGQDQRVRIVAIPQGEAPVWVRERWVGLELPIYPDQRGPETTLGHGVLSGPPPMTLDDFEAGRRGRLVVMSGYFVKAADAIEELERHAPDAAAWWRTHAPPSKSSWLVFEKECCQRLP